MIQLHVGGFGRCYTLRTSTPNQMETLKLREIQKQSQIPLDLLVIIFFEFADDHLEIITIFDSLAIARRCTCWLAYCRVGGLVGCFVVTWHWHRTRSPLLQDATYRRNFEFGMTKNSCFTTPQRENGPHHQSWHPKKDNLLRLRKQITGFLPHRFLTTTAASAATASHSQQKWLRGRRWEFST